MKKSLLLFALGALTFSCSGDSTTTPVNEENKVLLLKVDLLTNVFEGGKELVFPDNENFTISSDYNPPGDFGDITLNYDEVGMPIFAGTIIWMGTGEITYPEQMDVVEGFAVNQAPVQMPPVSGFVKVSYGESDEYYYPEEIPYEAL